MDYVICRWLQATERHPLLPKPGGDSSIDAANIEVASVMFAKG